MARKSIEIVLNEASKMELLDLIAHSLDADIIRRAKVVLACSDGFPTNKSVSELTGMNPTDVAHWRREYYEHGIEGLRSKHGGGKQTGFTIPDLNQLVLDLLSDDSREWSVEELAEATGATFSSVAGILRKNGITLKRTRRWNIRTVDELIPKTVDVFGLYVSKKEQAVILCCSESQIGNMYGQLTTRNRLLFEDFQLAKEPITLATALRASACRAKETSKQRSVQIWNYLSGVLDRLPDVEGAEYRVYVCSQDKMRYSGHKLKGVYFQQFTDTATWMGQVRLRFEGLRDRHQLDAADNLMSAIQNYIDVSAQNSDPFQWEKVQLQKDAASSDMPISCSNDFSVLSEIPPELLGELSDVLSRILSTQKLNPSELGYCCIPVIYDNEQVIFDVLSDHSSIMKPDDIQSDRMDSFKTAVEAAEPVIIKLRDRVGIRSIEMLRDCVRNKSAD